MSALERVLRLTPRTPEASTVHEPVGPGPLWHHKGLQLPAYIQHVANDLREKGHDESKAVSMAVGIVRDWAAGRVPNGKGHVHPDVRAAASKAMAEWEKVKSQAHAETAGKVKATVALAKPSATAPGAAPVQPGPYQVPSQTVSPSPPLPPDVKLPTAAEIRKLKAQVPDCTDASLSSSARNHLDAAAVKLGKDDVLAALHVLRAAQSDVYAAHKADLGGATAAVTTANVFTRVPEAEQSSANAEMIRSKDREMKWRALEQGIATAIDRIRRKYYHGSYGGIAQQGMFSADSESSLDKLVRLAGPGAGS